MVPIWWGLHRLPAIIISVVIVILSYLLLIKKSSNRSASSAKHGYPHSNLGAGDNIRSNNLEARTEPKTKKPPDYSNKPLATENMVNEDPAEQFTNAMLAIEYDPKTDEVWKQLQILPEKLRYKFLQTLENDPRQPPKQLLEKTLKEWERLKRPYETEELNDAFDEIKAYGDDAILEFQKVVDILGTEVDIEHLITKIRQKFKLPIQVQLQQAIETENEEKIIEILQNIGFRVSKDVNRNTLQTTYRISFKGGKEMQYMGFKALADFAFSKSKGLDTDEQNTHN